MKIEINREERDVKYPCLMEGKKGDLIVLFVSDGVGVALNDETGNYSEDWVVNDWVMDTFVPFKGSITLSNGE